MEVKFAQLLNQYGVAAEQTTQKIAQLKKDFDGAWEEYNAILENYQNNSDPEEKEALLDELNTFEADLEKADKELCKKIEMWNKNKDVWAANVKKAQDAAKKSQGKAKNNVEEPQVQEASQPQVAPQPQVMEQPQMVVAEQGVAVEEQKESNWFSWVIGITLTVVTLGVASKYLKSSS